MIQTSYAEARDNLASLLDKAVDDQERVIIKRRGRPDVALIAADELASLEETAHLFRSPANARRVLEAMEHADRGEGAPLSEEALDTLKRAVARGATAAEAFAAAGLPLPRTLEGTSGHRDA
jgi:antitoxin YefM